MAEKHIPITGGCDQGKKQDERLFNEVDCVK